MITKLETADRSLQTVRLDRQPRGGRPAGAMQAIERTLLDPDFRPLLFVLTISGLAAVIATAIRAM